MISKHKYEELLEEKNLIQRIAASENLDNIFNEIAIFLKNTWGFDSIGISLLNEDKRVLSFFKNFGPDMKNKELEMLLTKDSTLDEAESISIQVLEKKVPIYHDFSKPETFSQMSDWDKEVVKKLNLKENLMLPIVEKNRGIGVFHLSTIQEKKHFTTDQINHIQCFINTIAGNIRVSKRILELERLKQEQEDALFLIKKIASTMELPELLSLLTSKIQEVISMDGLVISLMDENRENLITEKILLPEKYQAMEKVLMGTKQPLKFFPENRISWKTHRPIFLTSENAEEFGTNTSRSFDLWEIKSGCYLPFSVVDSHGISKPLGLLFLFSQQDILPKKKMNEIQKILELFSQQLSNACLYGRLLEKQQEINHATEKNRQVLEIAQHIMNISSLDLIYKEILRALLELYNFDTGFLFLEKKKNLDYIYGMARHPKFESKTAEYEQFQQIDNGYRIDFTEGAAPTAHLRNNYYYFNDVPAIRSLPMSEKDKNALNALENPQSLLIMPVRKNGRSIGNFHLYTLEKQLNLSENDLQNIESLCAFIGTAISNAELYTMIEMQKEILEEKNIVIRKKNIQILEELKLAEQIQQNMVPQMPPQIPGAKMAALYKPMENIGGDFYDFLLMNQERYLGIFISDVSGHGVPAALITGMLKTILETAGEKRYSPHHFLNYINHNIIGKTNENFLTAFYGIYNIQAQTLLYARASHNYPYLIRNGEITELRSRGKILGILENLVFEEKEIQLLPGDKLFFYTDGLTESADPKGNLFEDILPAVLLENQDESIEVFVENIYNRLIAFSEQWFFEDDICIIGMEIEDLNAS